MQIIKPLVKKALPRSMPTEKKIAARDCAKEASN